MIYLDKKLIFIHIPKTAGTSIEHFFAPKISFKYGLGHDPKNFPKASAWRQHISMQQITDHGVNRIISEPTSDIFKLSEDEYLLKYQQQDEDFLKNSFKFCFVRNPLDRFVSEFFWRNNFNGFHGKRSPSCFDDFVENFESYYLDPIECHYRTQASFINNKNNIQMDFIGRFENFNDDWKRLLKLLGLQHEKAPFLQRSNHKDYMSYYNSSTRNIIEAFYQEDFCAFNY